MGTQPSPTLRDQVEVESIRIYGFGRGSPIFVWLITVRPRIYLQVLCPSFKIAQSPKPCIQRLTTIFYYSKEAVG